MTEGLLFADDLANDEYVAVYGFAINRVSRFTSGIDGEIYLFNAHGDVVALVAISGESVGKIIKEYDYDAFGNEAFPDPDDANPFRYCGEYYDKGTNRLYLRARDYDASTGRFTSEDTHWNAKNTIYGDNPLKIGDKLVPNQSAFMQSLNRYTYCINDPVNFTDYSGEQRWPGQTHAMVSAYIIAKEFLTTGRKLKPNKYIPLPDNKKKFADLYDENTREVWEIKPNKDEYKIKGPKQLQTYIDNIEGAVPGKSLGNGTFYYVGPGKNGLTTVFKVNYESYDNGMIYYDYDEILKGEDALKFVIELLAAAAALALIYFGIQQGADIPYQVQEILMNSPVFG